MKLSATFGLFWIVIIICCIEKSMKCVCVGFINLSVCMFDILA